MQTTRLAALIAMAFFLFTGSATQVRADGVILDDDDTARPAAQQIEADEVTRDEPTAPSGFTQSPVAPRIARGDQLTAEGKFESARREYEAAAEIVRDDGELPATALRRIANSLYFEGRYQTAGKVLLDLADEAAQFGDVVTQVWATADAAWVAALAGDRIDVEHRLAKLEKLLTSPYLPDAVRAEVANTRLAGIEPATSVAAGESIR